MYLFVLKFQDIIAIFTEIPDYSVFCEKINHPYNILIAALGIIV